MNIYYMYIYWVTVNISWYFNTNISINIIIHKFIIMSDQNILIETILRENSIYISLGKENYLLFTLKSYIQRT